MSAPTPPSAPHSSGLKCRTCVEASIKTIWQTFRDGTRHLRAECGRCGTFLRYLPQQAPPSALDAVKRLLPQLTADERQQLADLLAGKGAS